MNNDAQEAAMGLLSLSPSNFLLPPSPLVPLKRKQPHHHQQQERDQYQQNRDQNQHKNQSDQQQNQSKNRKRSSSRVVVQWQPQAEAEAEDPSTDSIRCICGSTYDDGFSIACDDCSRWCHAACFEIVEGEVPEEWRCWICVPRPVDKERAARLQKSRQKMVEQMAEAERERQKRRTSPGVDKKHRKTSANAIEGSSTSANTNANKRKRRASMLTSNNNTNSNSAAAAAVEEDVEVVVDIDEPWTHSYVSITEDIVPATATREKLRRHAQDWRGITALEPFRPPASPISVQQLPTSDPACVRPPEYAVHTTQPVPATQIITPFVSTITPSATYLADPLNAYAHLGMPKPFVHLIGPPLDLALDARTSGNTSRFVRSGCRPNAVLRPVVCPASAKTEDETTLAFAVFALRDLKADEEVVLGWEWDDGNAVHALPALIQTPHLFPPAHHAHLRAQMSNILHLLSSTFTTCACGARARDCALTQMERFVDQLPPMSEDRHKGRESGLGVARDKGSVDLGPLLAQERGFRTRERVHGSGGMTGVEMCDEDDTTTGRMRDVSVDVEMSDDVEGRHLHPKSQSPSQTLRQLRPPDPTVSAPAGCRGSKYSKQLQENFLHEGIGETMVAEEKEEKMPPKMRKRWIHREAEALKEAYGEDREVDRRWEAAAKREISSGTEDSCSAPVSRDGDVDRGLDEDIGITDVKRVESLNNDTTNTIKALENSAEINSSPDVHTREPYFHVIEHAPSPSSGSPKSSTDSNPNSDINASTVSTIVTTLHSSRPPPTTSPSSSFARLSLVSPVVGPLAQREGILRVGASIDSAQPGFGVPSFSTSGVVVPVTSPKLAPYDLSSELSTPTSAPGPPLSDVSISTSSPSLKDQATGSPQVLQHDWTPLRRTSGTTEMGDLQNTITIAPDSMQIDSPSPAIPPDSKITESNSTGSLPVFTPPAVGEDATQLASPPGSTWGQADKIPPVEGMIDHVADPNPPSPGQSFQDIAPLSLQTPPSPPSPPPPPRPPKVKMSLKDFALRKKKQREEEKSSINTSVEGGGIEASTRTPAIPTIEGTEFVDMSKHSTPRTDSNVSTEGRRDFVTVTADFVKDGAIKDENVEVLGISEDSASTTSVTPMVGEPATIIPKSPPRISGSYDTAPTYDNTSLQTKKEVVDQALSLTTYESNFTDSQPSPNVKRTSSPSTRTSPSLDSTTAYLRHPSQEDGEIASTKGEALQKRLPSLSAARNSYVPRSHTPPTQPRSFQISHPTIATSSARPPAGSRPPPSGPRALLRLGGNNHTPPAYQPPFISPRSYSSRPFAAVPISPSVRDVPGVADRDGSHSYPGRNLPSGPLADREQTEQDNNQSYSAMPRQSRPLVTPRGPSADRDKVDCDRNRLWVHRSRARAGGGGWGR